MNKDSTTNKRQTRQRRRKPPLSLTLVRLAFSKLGPVFPSLLGAWAYRIWFSTRRAETPRREKIWLEDAQLQVVDLAGIPVMTYQWGEPTQPLVVLVHGWNGRGSQMAAFARPLVEAGFHVLAYDAPGHGLSPGNSTNIFILSKVLTAIEDKVAPIHGIVAHSFGGMTAALAMARGLNVNKAVFLNSPSSTDHLISLFVTGLSISEAVKNNLVNRLKQNFGHDIFTVTSSVENARKLSHVQGLIIHDEKDHDVPVKHGRQIQQAWPGSELVVTNGLGHKRTLYNGKVLEAVSLFLSTT